MRIEKEIKFKGKNYPLYEVIYDERYFMSNVYKIYNVDVENNKMLIFNLNDGYTNLDNKPVWLLTKDEKIDISNLSEIEITEDEEITMKDYRYRLRQFPIYKQHKELFLHLGDYDIKPTRLFYKGELIYKNERCKEDFIADKEIMRLRNFNCDSFTLISPNNIRTKEENYRIWFYVHNQSLNNLQKFKNDFLIMENHNEFIESFKTEICTYKLGNFSKKSKVSQKKEKQEISNLLDINKVDKDKIIPALRSILDKYVKNEIEQQKNKIENKQKEEKQLKEKYIKVAKYYFTSNDSKSKICKIFNIGTFVLNRIIRGKYEVDSITDIERTRKLKKQEKEIIEYYLYLTKEEKRKYLKIINNRKYLCDLEKAFAKCNETKLYKKVNAIYEFYKNDSDILNAYRDKVSYGKDFYFDLALEQYQREYMNK